MHIFVLNRTSSNAPYALDSSHWGENLGMWMSYAYIETYVEDLPYMATECHSTPQVDILARLAVPSCAVPHGPGRPVPCADARCSRVALEPAARPLCESLHRAAGRWRPGQCRPSPDDQPLFSHAARRTSHARRTPATHGRGWGVGTSVARYRGNRAAARYCL